MHKRKNPDLIAWQRQSPANAVFWWGENERRAKQMVEDMFIDIPLDKKLLFLRLVRFEFGRAVRLGLLHPHLLTWINKQCDLVGRKQRAKRARGQKSLMRMAIRVTPDMYRWLEDQPEDSIMSAATNAVERYYRESGQNTPRAKRGGVVDAESKRVDLYVDERIRRVVGSKSGAVRKMLEWCMEQEK